MSEDELYTFRLECSSGKKTGFILRKGVIYYIPRQTVHYESHRGESGEVPEIFYVGFADDYSLLSIGTMPLSELLSKHYGEWEAEQTLEEPISVIENGELRISFIDGVCVIQPLVFTLVTRKLYKVLGDNQELICRPLSKYRILDIKFSYDLSTVCTDFKNFEVIEEVQFSEDGTSLLKFPCVYQDTYHVPQNVVRIEDSAFEESSTLRELYIPDSVEYISDNVFNNRWTVYLPYTLFSKYKEKFRHLENVRCGKCPFTMNFLESFEGYCTINQENYEHEIVAHPNYGYKFDKWSDGNTANPRKIELVDNMTMGAIYAPITYDIKVTSYPIEAASLIYPSVAPYRSTVEIVVAPKFGFDFVEWENGSKEVKRSVFITKDMTFTAKLNDMRCGENLRWSIVDEKLMLEGKGKMYDYPQGAPWHERAKEIKELILPDGLTSIGERAFSEMNHLQNVIVPNNVMDIGDNAFAGCSRLASITIGEQVEEIGSNAFNGCFRIDEMILLPKITPEIRFDTLGSVSSLAYLKVLPGYVRKYRIDSNWSRFDIQVLKSNMLNLAGENYIELK